MKSNFPLLATLFVALGCQSLSNSNKRLLTTVSSAAICGLTAGQIARDRDADVKASLFASAAACGLAAQIASEKVFFNDEATQIRDLKTENTNLKRGLAEGRLQDKNRDEVLMMTKPNLEGCNGESRILPICPDKNGDVGPCYGKIGWQYTDDKWAVKWIAYKSLNGCFVPPFKAPKQIDELTNELERKLKQ